MLSTEEYFYDLKNVINCRERNQFCHSLKETLYTLRMDFVARGLFRFKRTNIKNQIKVQPLHISCYSFVKLYFLLPAHCAIVEVAQ